LKDSGSTICTFLLENNQVKDLKKLTETKTIDDFELDQKDPMNIFLVSQNEVFKHNFLQNNTFSNIKLKKKSSIGINTKKMKTHFRKRNKKKVNFKEEDVLLDTVYSNNLHPIKFFKFDQNMKHFYTHEGKTIQKYSFEKRVLVKSFEGHKYVVQNLIFTSDYCFMIR
jgi:hypothetical protein